MSDETIYPEGITPELLMAYADGALEEPDARRIEAAIRSYPHLAREVEDYRATASAMAHAFDAPLEQPIPEHLAALVRGAPDENTNVTSLAAVRQNRISSIPVWGQAIAACAVFAFGAFFGSTQLASRSGAVSDDILIAGRLDAAHPLSQALELTASAEITSIPGGQLNVVATFPTGSGDPCREFEAAGTSGGVVGLACRRSGNWTVELLLHSELAASSGNGFQLASGFDGELFESMLDRMDAGLGLSKDAEKCLIETGWDAEICEVGVNRE